MKIINMLKENEENTEQESVFNQVLKLANEHAEDEGYYNYYEEEWPGLTDQEKVDAYFDYMGEFETAEELGLPIYNGYLQLSDRSVLVEINADVDEFYGTEVERALTNFERDYEVEDGVWQDGRSGRHIVMKPTRNNILRFYELQEAYREAEDKFIAKMNGESDEYESLDESIINVLKENDDEYKISWDDEGLRKKYKKTYDLQKKMNPQMSDKAILDYIKAKIYNGEITESKDGEVPYDNTTPKKCPICGKTYTQYPALSRKDNKTYICPDCGTAEAFEDFFGSKSNKNESLKLESKGELFNDLTNMITNRLGEEIDLDMKIDPEGLRISVNSDEDLADESEVIEDAVNECLPEVELISTGIGTMPNSNVACRVYKFNTVKNESLKLETTGMTLKNIRLDKDIIRLNLNGKDYAYKTKGDIDTDELFRKFNKMKGFSDGKAFAWLRKNSVQVKTESEEKSEFDFKFSKGDKIKNKETGEVLSFRRYQMMDGSLYFGVEGEEDYKRLTRPELRNNWVRVNESCDDTFMSGKLIKKKHRLTEEEYSFDEIINRMANATDYADLYAASALIQDSGLQAEVDELIGQCEDDNDDIETAYSIVTSDLLDDKVNKLNEALDREIENTIFIPLHRVVYEGINKISEDTGLAMAIEEIDQASDTVTTRITGSQEAYDKYINNYVNESKKLKTEGTNKKRVAKVGEFDNGHVLNSYCDWTEEEAQQKAKKASEKDPEGIYYVDIDDIMNNGTGIRWHNGKQYSVDETDYEYVNGKPILINKNGEAITESKQLKEANEGNQVEIMHFNNRLNEVAGMLDLAYDRGNQVLMENYLTRIKTMLEKYSDFMK